MKLQIAFAFILAGASLAAESIINDPVADFLSLPIKDRYTDGSEVVMVHRASIDIDSDGSPETLVGHHKMWWGDNDGIYWAIYTKEGDHFKRLTKPDEDVRIQFYEGSPDFMYVGSVAEQGGKGLLMAVPLLKRSDEEAELVGVERLMFISIKDGHASTKELPGLNLSKEADKALYQKYFAQAGHQGGFAVEKITAKQLKDQGYKIPDWKVAPQPATDAATSARPSDQPSLPQRAQASNVGPAKAANAKAQKTTSDEPTSSTPWSVIVILIVAATVLLWLLLKRRS